MAKAFTSSGGESRNKTIATLQAWGCMMISQTVLKEIRSGRIAGLGPKGVPSGIDKQLRAGPVRAETMGLVGDEQADLRVHGGPDKAILHYSILHYEKWLEELPLASDRLVPGGFGENFVSDAWTEENVCLGDVLNVGSAKLEVSQGRQPCWKLVLRFGVPDMALRVQRTQRTGWYYRVLEPGVVEAGNELTIVDRPNPGWPVQRLLNVLFVDRLNYDALEQMAGLQQLSKTWRETIKKRLSARKVEDWSERLRSNNPQDAVQGNE